MLMSFSSLSSVHLCNNSIQKYFQPSAGRDPALPAESMWSCAEFRSWLSASGRGDLWEDVVLPGMRRAVIQTLLTAQDSVEPRKASFELYGADFLLGCDLNPWLLEVNVSPTMACSTVVTARLCPAVQEDTLRVVLDRHYDRNTHTGGFQLIYKQVSSWRCDVIYSSNAFHAFSMFSMKSVFSMFSMKSMLSVFSMKSMFCMFSMKSVFSVFSLKSMFSMFSMKTMFSMLPMKSMFSMFSSKSVFSMFPMMSMFYMFSSKSMFPFEADDAMGTLG